jgi:clan AA aspartic protease (TIGR02281 family)
MVTTVFIRTKNKSWILIFFLLFILTAKAEADTVYLKNGRTIEGIIKSETKDSVELDIGFGSVGFNKNEVERIYKSKPDETEAIRQKWGNDKIKREARIKEERRKIELQPKQIEVSRESGHIFVAAKLNKKIDVNLLMDTGASMIMLTRDTAERLGIKTDSGSAKDIIQLQVADGRKVNGKIVVLDSVNVQGVEVKNVEAAVLFEDIGDTSFKDGLLGMSFLNRFNFKVDYKSGKLTLEKAE